MVCSKRTPYETCQSYPLKNYWIRIVYYNSDTCNIHTTHRAESTTGFCPFFLPMERRDLVGRILLALLNVAVVVLEEVFDDD